MEKNMMHTFIWENKGIMSEGMYMRKILKKLRSNRGQISIEFALLISSVSLVAIIVAYHYISSSKDLGDEMNNMGKKAENFTNITRNKSLEYIEKLNSSL